MIDHSRANFLHRRGNLGAFDLEISRLRWRGGRRFALADEKRIFGCRRRCRATHIRAQERIVD